MSDNPWFDRKRCPHRRIEHCPLYHAAHYSQLAKLGCVDDMAKPCVVERSRKPERKYEAMVAKLPTWLVRERQVVEMENEAREQRQRNLRAARLQ